LLGVKSGLFEFDRRKLYEDDQPSKEFLKWAKLPREKQSLIPPPI